MDPVDRTLGFVAARYKVPNLVDLVADPTQHFPLELSRGFRTDLPRLWRDLGFTTGAEIGVWRGEFSECICQTMPGVHLYCVDPWVSYREYTDHTRHDLIAGAFEITKERLAPYHVTYLRKFSTEAAKDVPDQSLDFVYVDGNHSLWHVVNDLTLWTKKVRPGGIIAGHDYIKLRTVPNFHVLEAVNAFTEAFDIRPWFLLGLKTWNWRKRDRERSYFWVQR